MVKGEKRRGWSVAEGRKERRKMLCKEKNEEIEERKVKRK
jgi:hypothetical protein